MGKSKQFYCPECGEVFAQGAFDYDYGTGLLNFECPCCGWYGTENEVGQ
jgi:predicted RNA-binding Zn-ribbon protein involved in translation (DUF1610 family)